MVEASKGHVEPESEESEYSRMSWTIKARICLPGRPLLSGYRLQDVDGRGGLLKGQVALVKLELDLNIGASPILGCL